MSYFYVYKMSHPETGEFYIGRRSTKSKPNEDLYRGSSVTWYNTLSIDVIENVLIKEILEECANQEELNEAEIKWILKNIENPLCKNAHIPSIGFHTKGPLPQEQKEKMRISSTGKLHTQETKIKISKSKTGKTLSEEHKKKLSESKKGKPQGPLSDEAKKKISEKNKGYKHTDEAKEKISNARKAQIRKPMSEETKRKISESKKVNY